MNHDDLMFARLIASKLGQWDSVPPRQGQWDQIASAGEGASGPQDDPLAMTFVQASLSQRQRAEEEAFKRQQLHEEYAARLQEQTGRFAHEDAAAQTAFGHEQTMAQQKHGWAAPIEGAQIGAATAAAEASRAQTAASQAETELRRRQMVTPAETRSPQSIENEAEARRLESQLAALQAQENPEQAAATIRSTIARLRGQPAPAAGPTMTSPTGLNQREREGLVTQLAATGDFEGVRALRAGARPEDVPSIASARAEERLKLIKEAALKLDVTAPWFTAGEGTEEPNVWQPGYISKSKDRALERAALLQKLHPMYARHGITPDEILKEYRANVD